MLVIKERSRGLDQAQEEAGVLWQLIKACGPLTSAPKWAEEGPRVGKRERISVVKQFACIPRMHGGHSKIMGHVASLGKFCS